MLRILLDLVWRVNKNDCTKSLGLLAIDYVPVGTSFNMLEKTLKKLAYKIRRKLNLKRISINGINLNTDPDFVPKGIRKLLLEKNYESQEVELVCDAIRTEDRVLEVGAGIGFVGIACAKICGSGKILSYEPNPKMRPVIEANYALNGLQPNLRSKVIATTAGELEFYFSEGVLSSSLVDRKQGEATRVEADAISSVVEEFQPTAIVMDAEGAEIDLFRACDLDGVSTVVVELHPHIVGAQAIEELRSFLASQGLSEKRTLGKCALFQRSH